MALVYSDAEIEPSKTDLLRAWVPGRPWAAGVDAGTLRQAGAYRFDDPDGEVGIETHLVRTDDGLLLQVPLTYRGAPLESASDALVTTMEHTVLGRRWVYDACADDVYLAVLLTAMVTGGRQADLEIESGGGGRTTVESKVQVRGSGAPGQVVPAVADASREDGDAETVVRIADRAVVVRRRLDDAVDPAAAYTLTGTWTGSPSPTLLASLR
jgi:hypothetical protein